MEAHFLRPVLSRDNGLVEALSLNFNASTLQSNCFCRCAQIDFNVTDVLLRNCLFYYTYMYAPNLEKLFFPNEFYFSL